MLAMHYHHLIQQSAEHIETALNLLKINAACLPTEDWIRMKTARLLLKEATALLEQVSLSEIPIANKDSDCAVCSQCQSNN